MSYAIISLAGRQFLVKDGDLLKVTRQEGPSPKVLFYKGDDGTEVGKPYLEHVSVELEKIEDKKDKKVVVARFKAKSRHRRKVGHRQEVSVFRVRSVRRRDEVSRKSTRTAAKVMAETMAEHQKEIRE